MSHLAANLAALEKWTPASAALIGAAAIPPGFEPAIGTDGSPTFLRTIADPANQTRQLEWLGNTSMPAASAAPLVASLNPATPGLGLSIGTGHEWLALLQKLPSAHALFVYEPDPALLKMALTICDLAEPLAAGKIILLSGSANAAAAELAGFLAAHLGHEPPTVLHPLPTILPERRNALLVAGESIVRHALAQRHATLEKLAAELHSIGNQPPATGTTVALIAPERYPGERPLHSQIAEQSIPALRIDDHASASIAARVQFLITHRPRDIHSDFFRQPLACIPPAIPVHTWVPPLVGPAFWQPSRLPASASLAAHDRIIVHAAVHQLLLESHGISKSQIELRPLALPRTPQDRPTQGSGLRTQDSTARVAIIADLPRIDSASLGLELPTPLAIAAEARELILADYLTVHFHSAPDILRRAQRKAGIAAGSGASDAALREPILPIIRDVLIPALPLLMLAEKLLGQQIPLRLIGDWTGLDQSASPLCVTESFTDFCASPNRWQGVALLVHLSPWGTVSPLVLDAAAAGVTIVCPRHPSDTLAGALPALLAPGDPHVRFLRPQPQQLFATIKSLLPRRTPG